MGLPLVPRPLDVNFERRVRKSGRILLISVRNYRAPLAGVINLENREATLVPQLYDTYSERGWWITFKILH